MKKWLLDIFKQVGMVDTFCRNFFQSSHETNKGGTSLVFTELFLTSWFISEGLFTSDRRKRFLILTKAPSQTFLVLPDTKKHKRTSSNWPDRTIQKKNQSTNRLWLCPAQLSACKTSRVGLLCAWYCEIVSCSILMTELGLLQASGPQVVRRHSWRFR